MCYFADFGHVKVMKKNALRTDGPTDRRTDGPTDKASDRVAYPQLKREGGEEKGEHKNCCQSLSDADEQRFLPPSFSL